MVDSYLISHNNRNNDSRVYVAYGIKRGKNGAGDYIDEITFKVKFFGNNNGKSVANRMVNLLRMRRDTGADDDGLIGGIIFNNGKKAIGFSNGETGFDSITRMENWFFWKFY